MNRREFLSAAATVTIMRGDDSSKPLLLVSSAEARAIQQAIRRNDSKYTAGAAALRKLADAALGHSPWSVAAHRPKNFDVPPHEYYSEGPYWWPDPKNPSGPYIRRDGERNPSRFDDNHRDLGAMSSATLALGMAAYFFNDDDAASHASKILSTWFAAPATRMNPDLEYGQAVRGVNTGRGTGIIDTVSLIHAVQGIVLLEQSGKLDKELAGALRRWFAEYLSWMTTSDKGLAEKEAKNNHGTWWTAQVAAYGTYLDDRAAQQLAWNRYREVLVPRQIQPDGSCPLEEARTRSLSYSAYNLDAFGVICRLAQVSGVDLWRYRAPNGVSLEKAVAYLTPYIAKPETWRKQQIAPFDPTGIVYPALAGAGLHSRGLLRVYHERPRANSAWIILIDWLVSAEEPRKKKNGGNRFGPRRQD